MDTLKNAFALLIGVGNDLPVTVRDATAVHNILADETLAGYKPENIILLTEKEATRKGILDAFDLLISKIDEESSVLLFYSGHGGFYEPWKQFYLVPNNFDPVEYEDTWVKAEELKEKIQAINSRRLIFFLDCCHAAGMTKSAPKLGVKKSPENILANADGLAQKIDDGKGMSIVSSCREDQLSYIMEGDSNSLFTKCLIEVLKGKHKSSFDEQFVRISEVVQYIFRKVPERNPEQKPYANLQIYDDFVLSFVPQNVREEHQLEAPITEDINKSVTNDVVTVFKESENANNVLLFVHGFSGEAAQTFGDIPKYLAADKDMGGWDLFPLGFSEYVNPDLGKDIWASTDDIDKIADYLTTSIKNKYGKYKRIAIVAHSLGGLVAQRAILDLDKSHRDRISHFILFGTPSKGIQNTALNKLWNKKLQGLDVNQPFIKKLRLDWDNIFEGSYPFVFKSVAATHDEFVSTASSLKPFDDEYCVTVAGNHFSMVQPENTNHDSYNLILNTLTNNTFHQEFTNQEDINLVLGEYDAVVKKLLPNVKNLDKRGLEQLIYALEGTDKRREALNILQNHKLLKNDSDLLGVLGGRFKRSFLGDHKQTDGESAIKFYTKALEIAQNKKDQRQIYYHAINLAFMSLIMREDFAKMEEYATLALAATAKDPFSNMWRLATQAEANLYAGNLEESKSFYEKAAQMAGIREKIAIHTNAYMAYTSLMQTHNPDDDFIKFLKINFLS